MIYMDTSKKNQSTKQQVFCSNFYHVTIATNGSLFSYSKIFQVLVHACRKHPYFSTIKPMVSCQISQQPTHLPRHQANSTAERPQAPRFCASAPRSSSNWQLSTSPKRTASNRGVVSCTVAGAEFFLGVGLLMTNIFL